MSRQPRIAATPESDLGRLLDSEPSSASLAAFHLKHGHDHQHWPWARFASGRIPFRRSTADFSAHGWGARAPYGNTLCQGPNTTIAEVHLIMRTDPKLITLLRGALSELAKAAQPPHAFAPGRIVATTVMNIAKNSLECVLTGSVPNEHRAQFFHPIALTVGPGEHRHALGSSLSLLQGEFALTVEWKDIAQAKSEISTFRFKEVGASITLVS